MSADPHGSTWRQDAADPGDALQRAVMLLATACALATAACALGPSAPVSESFTSMGTIASVSVSAEYREDLASLTQTIKLAFRQLEDRFTTYQPDSEISQLGRSAGAPVAVSEDTARILGLSKHFGDLTGGAFDVTVAPLVRLWGFGVRPPANPPQAEEIREQLRLVDYRRIALGPRTASLPAGMSVDLGAIGKGYAVDRGFELLGRTRVKAAMLDLGGNIRVLGRPGTAEEWTIGVRDPFDRSRLVGKLRLPDGMAVATSGNYERYVDLGGRRYAHIIDPRTGTPVAGMAGVTVIAPDATTTDALSTGLFVLGIEVGTKALRRVPGAAALFIPDREPVELWLTPGMEQLFQPVPDCAPAVRHTSTNASR